MFHSNFPFCFLCSNILEVVEVRICSVKNRLEIQILPLRVVKQLKKKYFSFCFILLLHFL